MTRRSGHEAPKAPIRLALYQPDIAQNTGAILRVAACLGIPVDIIEPCGFPISARGLKRAGLDYLDLATYAIASGWEAFLSDSEQRGQRLVLLSTRAEMSCFDFAFAAGDTLLLGQETAGVPPEVHHRADARIRIPMIQAARSLNVAVAGAIAATEALRQLGALPNP